MIVCKCVFFHKREKIQKIAQFKTIKQENETKTFYKTFLYKRKEKVSGPSSGTQYSDSTSAAVRDKHLPAVMK